MSELVTTYGDETADEDNTAGSVTTIRDQGVEGNSNNMNSSVNFLRNNFQLFGFGSSKQALFQTIKELMDNSIDAIRKVVTSPGNIRVEIVKYIDESLEVRVTDNGIGFTDPQKLLSVFQSTAIDSGVPTTGRYGLGLSALFLYSYSTCNKPIRIITKTNENENCFIGDYIIDQRTGNPTIVQSMATNTSLVSGSSIIIPIGWSPVDGSLVEELLLINMFLIVYIGRLQLLPQSVSLIHLVINVDELQVDRIFETDYIETVHQKFHDCSKYGYSDGSTVCVEETTDDTMGDISVQLTAILIELFDEEYDDSGIDPSEEQHINVKLIRYVNGVPLLDSSDTNDYKECGITAAFVSKLDWEEYGKKLTLFDSLVTHFSKIHFKLSTLYDPCHFNSSASNCDRSMEFIFLVNINSQNSLYTSLRKAAIVNQPDLTSCIANAGRVVMDAIKRKRSVAFMNSKEWRINQLNTRYIPSLSRSVARSISLMCSNPNPSSPDSSEHRHLLNTLSALEINQNYPVSSIASAVSSILLGIIGSDSIDDGTGMNQEAIEGEVYDSDEHDWT